MKCRRLKRRLTTKRKRAMEPNRKDDYQFNVMVVDDDPTILMLLKDLLSMVPGCVVSTSSNPSEAMQEIVKGAIDIVFTDVHMPGVTGIEMLKDIQSLSRPPEVVVMTSYPSDEIAQQAMEFGAGSLIAKPFEDISLVEVELEKAVKRILRQRSMVKTDQSKKELAVLSVSQSPASPAAEVAPPAAAAPNASVTATSTSTGPQEVSPALNRGVAKPYVRKIYDHAILEPLLEIEMERSKRYNRQFIVGFVDLPENFQLITQDELKAFRKVQIDKLEQCIRRSDVLIDAEREGMVFIGYECNKVGGEVVEHKLINSGFIHSGFSVFPTDGSSAERLLAAAKANLQNKRKFQIVVYEPEDFFGRIVQNMLADPKYHVTWVKSLDQTYQTINRKAENLRLFVLSLSRDPKQWEFLVKLLKDNLVRWPILLFIDIPLTRELKQKLRQLGVRAVVNKGVSQEEFLYIVQSFVVPRPAMDERKNFRALTTIPVVYRHKEGEVSSNTFTVSRDGLFIRDLNPPPSGSIIDVSIYVPGLPEPLRSKAEVLYVVPYFVGVNRFHVAGLAVKFVEMSTTQRDQLDRFVNECLTTYLI